MIVAGLVIHAMPKAGKPGAKASAEPVGRELRELDEEEGVLLDDSESPRQRSLKEDRSVKEVGMKGG